MPLYEYECPACDRVYEVMQKFSDAPLAECPTCKGPIRKLMSLSSFALKGSGWYTTDYKKSGGGSDSASSASASSSSSSSGSGSGGSKPSSGT